jgi:thioredoxin reductase
MNEIQDVAIVGAGAAGLSAALVLGRCRRSVFLFDAGRPRNRASRAVHCLLGQEGTPPAELLAKGRSELARYPTVKGVPDPITEITPLGGRFLVASAGGGTVNVRRVLLATGVTDEIPQIDGIDTLYGRSVHHCPYCDGFEHRDQAIAVYGTGDTGAGLALMMKQWSRDVMLFTGGASPISADLLDRLEQQAIEVRTEPISRLEGTGDGALRRIHLQNGEAVARTAMFFTTGCRQGSDLSTKLGCARDEKGGIVTDPVTEESSVKGVYVAGDASREVLLVAVAIAEGAKAGVAINRALLKEEGLG